MPSQGDIVLIPIPFTDPTSTKRRPVIVISNDSYQQTTTDMLVVAMTSAPIANQYSFTLTNNDLVSGTLNRSGTVRVDKIYTLSQNLVVRTFGQVDAATIERIKLLLQQLTTK